MDKKNYAVIALVCALAIMAVGYSLLAQTLTINGTATIASDWDVAITDITEGTPTGGATNAVAASHTGTTATFNVNYLCDYCYKRWIIECKTYRFNSESFNTSRYWYLL